MSTSLRTLPALSLLATLVLAACGRDAESAPGDGSAELFEVPHELAAPASEPGPIEAMPAAALDVASEPERMEDPAPAAPRPRPAPAPGARPAPPVPPTAEPTAPPPEPLPAFVPAGTLVTASVESELSTARSAVGDRFHARLVEDILGPQGEVLLPQGATLNGRVAESRESGASAEPAVLRVEIESVSAAGRTLPLRATVVELESAAEAKDSDTRTAAKVGAGVAAGAIVGRILGRDRDATIKGAVVGAAAGTAVALATRDGQAVVKPGARLVVRLDDRLVVEE